MNMQKFSAMYACRFRALTVADGLPEWQAKIEPGHIDEGIMGLALDAIDEHHRRLSDDGTKMIAAPRLGEVMQTYRRIAGDSKQPAATRKRRPLCGVCDDGVIYVLLATGNGPLDLAIADPRRRRKDYTDVRVVMSCCPCQDDAAGLPSELPPDGIPYWARREHAVAALELWNSTGTPLRFGGEA